MAAYFVADITFSEITLANCSLKVTQLTLNSIVLIDIFGDHQTFNY